MSSLFYFPGKKNGNLDTPVCLPLMIDLQPANTPGQLGKVSPHMADMHPANTTLCQLGKIFPLICPPTLYTGSAG